MVSIITPCYNAADYIGDAIESVLSQTYQDWEMIIVDDCSSDNSAAIIQNYARKDPRITYLKTESPSGSPAKPRNIAIERAKGRFIAFLDSDDVWMPTKLESQIAVLEDNQVAVVFSNYEKINEGGERSQRFIIACKEVGYNKLLKGNVIANSTGMYDSTKVGKVYSSYVQHEDYVLWLSILKQGYVARNTNQIHALYRLRTGSVSANKFKVLGWQWRIYREIEQLSVLKTMYCFAHYVVQAIIKRLK